MIVVPEDANAYLQRMYGDWARLPPENQRKSHHLFVRVEVPPLGHGPTDDIASSGLAGKDAVELKRPP